MATWSFFAGQRLRASDLINMAPVAAVKATDESVNSGGTGTTLHNDAALAVSLRANTLYWLDLALIATEAAGTSIDLKVGWTFPTGCRLDLVIVAPHVNWVATAGSALEVEWAAWQNITTSPSPTVTFGTSNAAFFSYHVRGVVSVGSTAGTLRLQWAQGTASASNLTVKSGSSLVLVPLT